MKVLLAGASLLPAYGGPAFSVTRLALALADAGIEVGLWAPDQSALVSPLVARDAEVQRLAGAESAALGRFGIPDVIHDNGMWLPHNHRLAQLADRHGIPRVVSTRGMLEPWAVNHKRWKKKIAWWMYQEHDLKRAVLHHATAETEARNLRHLALGVPVSMIPNGVDIPDYEPHGDPRRDASANPSAAKTALFMGRIYPVKGLPMLIEAWARVRPHGWRLQIAGPDEAGHLAQVQRAVAIAGLSSVVSFLGPVAGTAKQSAFHDADLFVLPTQSENFGMVIAEALANSLPVLTTTAAPWSELQARGCGWWVEPTVDGIAQALREATATDATTLGSMGARGRNWVAAEFAWEHVAMQFKAMYAEVSRGYR